MAELWPVPESRRRGALFTILVMFVAGTLLHFTWEWSGRSPIVAAVAPVNESTWEHLKVVFWPALVTAAAHWVLYDRPEGWVVATAVRAILPAALIVILFYGYTALVGTNLFPLDYGTFLVSVVFGEVVGHSVMDRAFGGTSKALAAGLVIAAAGAFIVWSHSPPDFFLFEAP